MAAAYKNLTMKEAYNIVESLPMPIFRKKILRRVEESKELARYLSIGADFLSEDDRYVVTDILQEALHLEEKEFSNKELDWLKKAITSRSTSLR